MRFVRFEPEAQDEFDAAVDWYTARNKYVAPRFIDAVQEAVEAVLENPEAWTIAPQVALEMGVRRRLLGRFPYALVYMLIAVPAAAR